jgi:hypothetical protein
MSRTPGRSSTSQSTDAHHSTEIQRLLGHASVQTTERYISTTLARLKQSTLVLERGKDFDPRPLGASPIVKPAIAGIH